MQRLSNKVIRVGDRVRIINPLVVERVGYPLSLSDVEKIIENDEKKIDLIKKLSYCGRKSELFQGNNLDSDLYRKLIRVLASFEIKRLNFGGAKRSLHTRSQDSLKDREFLVVGKRFAKTGVYNSASRGYDDWNGEFEYEPAFLSKEKTHIILELGVFADTFEIEAINVEKVNNN